MKYLPLVITVLLLLCFATPAQTSFPDDGQIKDGVYYNSFFDLSFTYPKNWIVPDEALKKNIRELANEAAAKRGTLAHRKDAYLLLTVSRQPLGTPSIGLNPAILMVAEKISHVPGNPNAKDFLLGYRPIKLRQGVQPTLNEPVEFRVAGLQFFRDDYRGEINGISLSQSIFVHFKKGYALVITFMAEDKKGVEEMVKSMTTILPTGKGSVTPN